ncbi:MULTISPECIES: PfkB family carbohydrate kinase [unclassified Rhizobium]|uniref:PfkB family carbohydrate kinase n=1 Tax=Rhizobium sp. PP-CC-3G-465 TaxID=2135648 RepID=UPI000D9E8C80|nr:sugar/nucleoside kinase (ribokinase family) [Rhizobium sp. PP-WC-1G-195]TCQ05397.1 sugar/nucleoside kinase (ribokinase family) [Rhizobium sp. PP-F2F-G36]TCQ26036.1 sugar/nucleoside kinase (ribokinase family) [Rhizobium sp. PP-CC-3G-465]
MAPHRLDVLGFGAVAIDDIVYVDRPLKAGKGKVVGRTRDFGGNVATALVAVAKLGGQAGFIGWLGSTPDEDPSASELERQGVDVSRAPRRADARAIRSVITVGPDGDRFIAYDDDVPHGTCHDLSDETLSEARVLLVDGYATHSERTVARARALGLSVVADIEWSIGTATDRLIALADHLVLPLAYAEAQTGETAPAAILRHLWTDDRAAVVLTDGDRGAFVRQAGDAGNWHVPAYAVRAVDTTGAGDCFHGAYALALARGQPPIDCVRYAAAAAAISVTGKGGRMALPDHPACTALMQAAGAPRPLAMP